MSDFNRRIHYAAPNLSNTANSEITCCVNLDNFSTYIALFHNNILLGLEVYDHPSKHSSSFSDTEFKQFELLKQSYQKLFFYLSSSKNTLIPSPLFDIFSADAYMRFNFENIDNDTILYDDIPALNITQVYALNRNFKYALTRNFPEAVLKSQKSILLEQFYKHNNTAQNMYVHTRQDCFDIFVFNEKGLLLSNTFKYNSAQDYIFFLMSVVKQLELNPQNLYLFLSGEMDKEGGIYNFIYKYIRHISFMPLPQDMEWALKDIPYHYFLNLVH